MSPHITEILEFKGYVRGLHYDTRGERGVDAWESVLEWKHPSDAYPTEAQVNTWEAEFIAAKQLESQAKAQMFQTIHDWRERASQVAADAAYFKNSSDIIWEAIENGKPNVSAQEIDDLHTAFSAAIAQNQFWADSHNWVLEMYDVAMNPNNPLHATHGTKAFRIIAWYSFNVVASSVAAQALMLKLAGIGG